ncbi:hypothetical protein Bbelb_127150 [Branchiostoma belcheri]|nr:hypothetical protein Bbelb_127150 [Branchiostoma belcheri]
MSGKPTYFLSEERKQHFFHSTILDILKSAARFKRDTFLFAELDRTAAPPFLSGRHGNVEKLTGPVSRRELQVQRRTVQGKTGEHGRGRLPACAEHTGPLPDLPKDAAVSETMGEESVDPAGRRKGVRKDNFTLSALRLNTKEDRLLDHRKHMLNAESAYVLRMMDVSEKLLVIRFKSLREKLSRQTSNLTEEEVETFRRSDLQTSPRSTCFSRHMRTPHNVASTSKHWCSPPAAAQLPRKRPKSATGAAMKLPPSALYKPPKSAPASGRRSTHAPAGLSPSRSDHTPASLSPSRAGHTPASLFSVARRDNTPTNRSDHTPATRTDHTASSRSDPMPAGLSMSVPVSAAVSPAELTQITRPELASAPAKLRATAEGKTKYLSGPMVELAMEEDRERKQKFEDNRKRMLERSRVASAGLLQKKDEFLKRLDAMLHDDSDDNILEQIASGQFDEKSGEGSDEEERRRERELRRKRRLRFRNIDRNEKTEILAPEEYWKNINKCQYLRLPDGTEDLSGVVTLVSEQRKLFQVWRDTT